MTALSRISPGDIPTFANGVLGFVAMIFIQDLQYLAASTFLFLAMAMDGLDGYIARKFGSKHNKGQVLDSIADSVSFVFAPALLIYAEFRETDGDALVNIAVLVCSVVLIATGLFRLARFSAGGYQLSYFLGMPAPAAALLMVLMCLLFGASETAASPQYMFAFDQLTGLVLATGFLAGFLMASEIRYPKLHGKMVFVTGAALVLAILPAFVAPFLVSDQDLYTAFSRIVTGIALTFILAYVFGGPLYERLKGDKS